MASSSISPTILVAAVLSPPKVSLLPLDKGTRILDTPSPSPGSHDDKTCRLCGCGVMMMEMEGSSSGGAEEEYLTQTMRTMVMAEVGLDLGEEEEDLTLCPSCSSQLVNLVKLKKEMDRLGEQFVTMVLGLQTLLFSNSKTQKKTGTTPLEEEGCIVVVSVKKEPSQMEEIDDEGLTMTESDSSNSGQEEEEVPAKVSDEGFKPQSCKVCSRIFTQTIQLETHMKTHLPAPPHHHPSGPSMVTNKGPQFFCPVCHKKFTRPGNLKQHTRLHTQEALFPCPSCPKRFLQKNQLLQHALTHRHRPDPEKEKRIKCGYCPMRFLQKRHLEEHVKTTHLKEPSQRPQELTKEKEEEPSKKVPPPLLETGGRPLFFTCHICSQSFTRAYTLDLHIAGHSANFACGVCNKTFQNHSTLTLHASIHSTEKAFECKLCSRRFPNKPSLKAHSKSHLPEAKRPFPCSICPRRFNSRQLVENHVNSVHDKKKKTFFPCPNCPKRFIRECNLEIHIQGDNKCSRENKSRPKDTPVTPLMMMSLSPDEGDLLEVVDDEDSKQHLIVLGEVDIVEEDMDPQRASQEELN